ncbi:hypothetical protein X975_24463, partial [Stegodyphus mimosarum]
MKVVPERSSECFLSVINECILPKTTIISNCWKAYNCLSDEGFELLTINDSVQFKDLDTGANINKIEGTWSTIKCWVGMHFSPLLGG